ncbi:triose-phosphate isomerase [Litoribacillus peritrichatus]|uniref:Triosephosphate isomerase n=1 Tax=Litoribacillus peritrichatus TaxID=718191 RepID=A0ABP7MWA4_9GAMM
MRKSLVAGNWKMNGSLETVDALAEGIVQNQAEIGCDVLVCPVSVHLDRVSRLIDGSLVKLGAQNCSDKSSGAYTGEVSAEMLKEVGCSFVILGHSERRTLFSEGDELIRNKLLSVLDAGLIPVLCVGETLDEREQGVAEAVVKAQVLAALKGVTKNLESVVVAYEPVWAIGTGLTATPEQAQAMHAFIRSVLAEISEELSLKVRILYGGSVKPENAREIFGQPDIDGGLIGGASLKVKDFISICQAAG